MEKRYSCKPSCADRVRTHEKTMEMLRRGAERSSPLAPMMMSPEVGSSMPAIMAQQCGLAEPTDEKNKELSLRVARSI